MTQGQANLRWELRRSAEGGASHSLLLRGEITETAPLQSLATELAGEEIVIDTGEISRINSVGVSHWIRFLRDIPAPKIVLVRCSPPIVAQLNTVFDFRGGAEVRSVLAPFYCGHCDQESLVNIHTTQPTDNPAELVQSDRPCQRCGEPLTFDDLPDRYFMFLRMS